MDKKDNTIYYAVGAVALAGGAYYAYKKGLFDKILGKKPAPLTSGTSTTSVTSEENKLQAMKNEVETSYTPLTNPNSYQSKVMKIQDDIGARSDGKVGKQTNTMFKAKYGLDKGDITPLNIDYYLNQVNTNDTLAARQAKKEKAAEAIKKAASVTTSVAQKLAAFKTAFNAGAKKFTLVTAYNAPVKLYNAAGGGLVDTGKTKNFSAGSISATNVTWGTNTASLSNDGGKTYYVFPIALLVLTK
jgi:hypothetical protein